MKKLIFGLIVALTISLSVQAQTPSVVMTGSDTVVNTSTVDLTYNFAGDFNSIAFQLVATKLTGTVAGTVKLQASVDGTNYLTINTAGADTFTVTNVATQSYFWVDTPGKYKYYKLNCIGSGTSTYIVRGYAQPRKN